MYKQRPLLDMLVIPNAIAILEFDIPIYRED